MTVATLNRLITERNDYFINSSKIPRAVKIIKIEEYRYKRKGVPIKEKKGYDIYFLCKKQIEHYIVGSSFKDDDKLPTKITLFNY